MQLIVETETALDIERNMSTVESIQNNIIDKVGLDDLNNKKCNGNNKIADEESKEIATALANIPMVVEDDEAELSNVDLSEIINKQNNTESNNALIDESHDDGSLNKSNGIDTNETETINEPEEMGEEEYMEDDIISIREEGYDIVSEPPTENTVDDGIKEDHIDESSKIDIKKDSKKSLLSAEVNVTVDEDADVIEVIDESQDSNDHCKNETEPLMLEEKDDIHIIEESQDSPAQYEKDSEPPKQKEKDDIEVIEESEDLTDQCEKKSEPPIQEEKDEIQIIEASNNSSEESKMQTESSVPEAITNTHIATETVPFEFCEKKMNSPKQDNIDLITEDKNDCVEIVKDRSVESKDNLDYPMKKMEESDNNEITALDETEIITSQCDNISDLPTENEKNVTEPTEDISEIVTPCENQPDIEIEDKEEFGIIGLKVVPIVEPENETESLSAVITDKNQVEKILETETDDTLNSSNSAKSVCDEVSNTDDSSVQKDAAMDVEEIVDEAKVTPEAANSPAAVRDEMDVEEIVEKPTSKEAPVTESTSATVNSVPVNNVIDKPIICKLSNTLDILSDDDEEEDPVKEAPPKVATPEPELEKVDAPKVANTVNKQCINIEEDDDIMLIDEDTSKTEQNEPVPNKNKEEIPSSKEDANTDSETGEKTLQVTSTEDQNLPKETTSPPQSETKDSNLDINIKEKTPEDSITKPVSPLPLVPDNFLKTAKKKLADMTRDEIEEFCILKIVESIMDRSSLSDIKNKLKTMTQGLEEYRKKAMMLTKQNRDLQVVLKSVQEEQKKAMGDTPITPLKITRSVGMQVYMEKTGPRKKGPQQNTNNKTMNNPQPRPVTSQAPRPQKPPNQHIPVPRLVPANNPALKTPCSIPQINQANSPSKNTIPPNGVIKPLPVMKAEKRPHHKMPSSVTVDLTDDEPPTKLPCGAKTSPAPPVRLVPPQHLMAPQRQPFATNVNSPRKVYIPISGPQNQALRPGQTIMLKTVPAPGIRARCPMPQATRVEPNPVRMGNRVAARHPAPLPCTTKQYQPPNWKPLPPAPDLKLSKVENGIVISWKIEGIPEDTYEEIASYQLYAYQETTSPPSTTLWKKIGDVKALPLPMACTLTQFMAGFKYYFAVRAVDIRSRFGPFSLPGSILLLSKNI